MPPPLYRTPNLPARRVAAGAEPCAGGGADHLTDRSGGFAVGRNVVSQDGGRSAGASIDIRNLVARRRENVTDVE